MRVVNEDAVISLLQNLTREECYALLNELHAKLRDCTADETQPDSEKLIFQPLRTNITTKNSDTTLVMPASDTQTTSVKILTAPHTGNLTAMVTFFDPEGTPLGIISGTTLTPFRTALTVMILFTKYQGPKSKLVFFGAGRQTEWHIRLALLLHDAGTISEIVVVNRNKARSEQLIESLGNYGEGVKFTPLSLQEVSADTLKSANGIFTCTPSREPLFPFSYLDNNSTYFLSLIGSYVPSMHEIDEPTLLSGLSQPGSRIFVDSKSACLEESGELIDAKISPDQLVEIGELDDNFKLPVPDKGNNTILKAVGMGIMDLSMGKALLKLAAKFDAGVEVPW